MRAKLDWNKYTEAAVRIAAEGAVMYENNGVLPVTGQTRIALFGRMQNNYCKSGTGSGGMVNVKHVVTVREALEKADGFTLDPELLAVYEEFDRTDPIDKGIGWGNEPWSQEELVLDPSIVAKASERNDLAVIVIARLAGEDRDNVPEKGAYFLSDKEEDMIAGVCAKFDKTVVLLNTGSIIDMSFVKRYSPSAVISIWQGGMSGALAVPMLLKGEIAPSGHLTDTVAASISDYPSDKNFGKGDGLKDNFEEDIYVGYRFFETFAKDKVLYPFGFGLTYTEFSFEDVKLTEGDEIKISFKVRNKGAFKGRCVPMLFVSCPQGKLGKPSKVLCGFKKTRELMPSEEEEMEIAVKPSAYASYDDSGKTGNRFSWVLENGTYEFFLGENVRDVIPAGRFDEKETRVLETTGTGLAPIDGFQRILPSKEGDLFKITYEPVPLRTKEALDSRLDKLPSEIPYKGDLGISFVDVAEGRASIDEFISELSDEQLCLIVRGEGMGSPKVTTGTAGAFAGTSKELRDLKVPSCCCSDGPSGMRIDSGKCAFAIPNGTCIASTFDTELITELFGYFGLEMISNEIDVILGPGMNIHRHPLNGRNFEYFSEDPFLTGMIAVSELKGLHKNKVTGCIKHFCTNNRERNRQDMSSNVSERALREIYLKGFEIAVKEGDARCVMTVYNRINGTYGSSNYELTTKILREDFGFEGIVMSDWWANICAEPYGKGNKTSLSETVRAQNDLYMCCHYVELRDLDTVDVHKVLLENDPRKLTRADLQRCARNILKFALGTPAMDRVLGKGLAIDHIDSPFSDDDVPVKADTYFEIDDGAVIDMTGFDTVSGHDAVFGLTVLKPGAYEFTLTASSDLPELAQVPMTFFYTSIPVSVLTWNGTNGQDTKLKMKGFCGGQPAIIRLHFGAPGVRLKLIEAKFVGEKREEDPWGFAD